MCKTQLLISVQVSETHTELNKMQKKLNLAWLTHLHSIMVCSSCLYRYSNFVPMNKGTVFKFTITQTSQHEDGYMTLNSNNDLSTQAKDVLRMSDDYSQVKWLHKRPFHFSVSISSSFLSFFSAPATDMYMLNLQCISTCKSTLLMLIHVPVNMLQENCLLQKCFISLENKMDDLISSVL